MMLKRFIEENKQSVTTLTTLFVILEHYLECKEKGIEYTGLFPKEINHRYKIVADKKNTGQEFHPSYVKRHTGQEDLYEERGKRYFIRNAFVNEIGNLDIQDYCSLIVQFIQESQDNFNELFLQIEELLMVNNLSNIHDFISGLFDAKHFRNYGQIFEVLSFSILKVYFESFGFELKRFSVSFSNDGGMDFISSNGFYQVTSSATNKKIDSDLHKLQGIRRVFVLTKCSENLKSRCLNSDDVTELLTTDDIKEHFLGWMVQRDKQKSRLLNSVLSTIKAELSRETN